MKYLLKIVALVVFLAMLASCASPDVKTYAKQEPALKLEHYFNGKLIGHGLVMNRSGEVTRRFVVNITGVSGKNAAGEETLTLNEQFDWSDGVHDSRVWTLRRAAADAWLGTASDVVGTATGKVSGNALNWQYVLALPLNGSTYHLDFDDWMFLMDEKVMLNKTVFSKFGIRLGETLISFQKQS
jgi:hypothetical protein